MRSVATTEVAQPLMMLTADAATAVDLPGSPASVVAAPVCRLGATWRGGGGWRGIWVVRASSTICGSGAVGARRMMRVWGALSGPLPARTGPLGVSVGGRAGLFGSVTGQPAKVPTLRPRLASHGTGSTRWVPPSSTSKCRWGPVELPRLPIVAIWSPAITR